jgi:hypothetical protein
MGNRIVMKTTIDHLATTKQFDKIDELMGASEGWETVEMKDESTYYKKELK